MPKVYGFYAFVMAVVNIIAGYVLIFGHAGFERMGIRGAGLASTISEFIALIYIVGYTLLHKNMKRFNLFRFSQFSMEMWKKILNLSAPLIVQNLLSMGAWFIFFVFIEKSGEHELAISNMVRGVYMISMTPMWGFSIAANSMVSNIIGQSRQAEVPDLLRRIIRMTFYTALVIVFVNVLFPKQILAIFTSDVNLINDSIGSYYVIDIAMIFFSFAIVCISAVSGTGATRTALYIEIAAILIYVVYNYLAAFIFKWPVELVWVSEILYWIFTGVASYLFIRSMRWSKIRL
jgi:Na+-driven multidrug efflux pump